MREPTTALASLVWGIVSKLVESYSSLRPAFFETHIEPLQNRFLQIHKDYVQRFAAARQALLDARPPESVIAFLKERRLEYEYERQAARDVATALESHRKRGLTDDRWRDVEAYCTAILGYMQASASGAGYSWYTDFMRATENRLRGGLSSAWPDDGFSGNPRRDLVHDIDRIINVRLRHASEEVSRAYAKLRATLL